MTPRSELSPARKGGIARFSRVLIVGGVVLGLSGALAGNAYLFQPTPAHAETPKTLLAPISFSDIAKKVRPAVVSIRAKTPTRRNLAGREEFRGFNHPFERFFREFNPRRDFGRRGFRERRRFRASQGSGFFISADGYVVTNNHVIDKATEVTVITDKGKKFDAKVIGRDPKTDLALLKVNAKTKFEFVEFATADIEVGDWVVAVGNPFGLGGTVTAGIVSARGRDIGSGPYDDFLQIDASINKGNSGGPTFSLAGKVVGVNTAIYSPNGGSIGIGFAIPASTAVDVIEDLKKSGSVTRGWLGVHIQPVSEDIADSIGLKEASGAMVMEVNGRSPAERAGLRSGDTILEVAGKRVSGPKQLAKRIAAHDPGSTVDLTIWRDGGVKTVSVKLGRLPSNLTARRAPDRERESDETRSDAVLGLYLAPADEFLSDENGVVIAEVMANSVAATKGLRRGDVILRVAGEEVNTPRQVERLIEEARRDGRRTILLRVKSNRRVRFVGLPVKKG